MKISKPILRYYLSFQAELSHASAKTFLTLYLQSNICCFFRILVLLTCICFAFKYCSLRYDHFLHLIFHSVEKYLLNLSLISHAYGPRSLIFDLYLQNIATFPPLHHLQEFDKTFIIILSPDLPMDSEAGLGPYLAFPQPQFK